MRVDPHTFQPIGPSENPGFDELEQARARAVNAATACVNQAQSLEEQARKQRALADIWIAEAEGLEKAIAKLKS